MPPAFFIKPQGVNLLDLAALNWQECNWIPAVLQVPFRRIQLTGGSGVFDVYDTSGPQARPQNPLPMPDHRCCMRH